MSNIDKIPLRFGQYKGMTPEQIADEDPSYIVWLWENVTPSVVSKTLMLACEDEVDAEDDEIEW